MHERNRIKEHQQYIRKKETNKPSDVKYSWKMNNTFAFNSVNITSKLTFELNILEAFNLYRNFGNIINSEFPRLSYFWNKHSNIFSCFFSC